MHDPRIKVRKLESEVCTANSSNGPILYFAHNIYTVKGEIIAGLNNCVFADIWVFKH